MNNAQHRVKVAYVPKKRPRL